MLTLGINAAFHDSAACIVRDGVVIAAAEEERFTHVKHGKRPIPFSAYELPFHAVDYCLKAAGAHLRDVDHIAYSFEPGQLLGTHRGDASISLPLEPSAHPKPEEWLGVWDPLFLASIVNAPRHLTGGVPLHLQARFVDSTGGTGGAAAKARWHFVPHHLAHAASAFHPSPYERAAVAVFDGRGERASTSYAIGQGNQLDLISQVFLPNSLGLLYERMTSYLGFLHSSDEYKVMALASYGKPLYRREFELLVRIGENGQYRIAEVPLTELFGPARGRGGPLEQRHFDIAHSLQVVLEDTVLELMSWLHRRTGSENLCLAGGVALNCVMNARIRDRGPFRAIWVQPAAGDAGTALGAALWIDARESGRNERRYRMSHAYLGPEFTDAEIQEFLDWTQVPYRRLGNVAEEAAGLLAQNKVLGWFQGRMEYGPRALGARSILASPLSPGMQARLNEIKDREDFRPVAPVVLAEEAEKWFENAQNSPFMLFVHDVRPERAERIPAVRHVDGTARIQTIRREANPLYHQLLREFQQRTGVPILVNTSFNTRGEPIVCTPRDAVESFWTSPLDALVIGSFLLEKAGRR